MVIVGVIDNAGITTGTMGFVADGGRGLHRGTLVIPSPSNSLR